MDLDTVLNELYGLLPEEFAATRKVRASEAQAAGNRDLVAAIRKLRRPTTSAWLANSLVRDRPTQIATLLELGAAMQKAQADLAGAQLRQLSQQRQDVVNSLSDAARQIAANHGKELSESTIRELEETLDAAIVNAEARDALAAGHLSTAMRYSGLGSDELSGVVAKPSAKVSRTTSRPKGVKTPPSAPAIGSEDADRTRRHAEAEVAQAEREVAEHSRQREVALDEIDRCDRAIKEAGNLLHSLRNERKIAQAEVWRAERALSASQLHLSDSRRRATAKRAASDSGKGPRTQ
jgi:hypothetical protein